MPRRPAPGVRLNSVGVSTSTKPGLQSAQCSGSLTRTHVLGQLVSDGGGHVCAEAEHVLQGGAAQIQVAVLHSQRLFHLRPSARHGPMRACIGGGRRERQRRARIEDLQPAALHCYLHLARRHALVGVMVQ